MASARPYYWTIACVVLAFVLTTASGAQAQTTCARTITADVVVIDQPIMHNRLGAQNINAMMFALKRDVDEGSHRLRADKRPRPMVLRMAAEDCLHVTLTNWLTTGPNPHKNPLVDANGVPFNTIIDDQVADRHAGFHPQGLELVDSIASDSSFVGKNSNSLVAPGETRTYKFYARGSGTFLVSSYGATVGGEATGGNVGNGLFAAVNVQPKGAKFYRSQVTEEELRLATIGSSATGHPKINYEAKYPNSGVWDAEGKGDLPVLNMLTGSNELVHSDINAIIVGPGGPANPDFPASTFPLEAIGKRNPSVPNRLEPYREFTVIFHDENAVAQAFPKWFSDPVVKHTLHGVRDTFLINYGSNGVGAEVIANRLGVGPMHDCLSCAYEEFFLTSFAVGDPAVLVDTPANLGLENCDPALNNCGDVGPKATLALFPDDPSNVHHSYQSDRVVFRNLHAGKEQHIFHLHNHQWLFNANDDNSNYIDAQGIGPGSGYTYEINFGGSGNRNKTTGDAIFHCHFYPHFAQGMWEHWRIHDAFEAGTRLAVSGGGYHTTPFDLADGTPASGARALPDGEIVAGTPIPAVVPLPGRPMAPIPGEVTVQANPETTTAAPSHATSPDQEVPVGSLAKVVDRSKNPGYPFWVAGIEEIVGQRPPTPPLDLATPAKVDELTAKATPGSPTWDPSYAMFSQLKKAQAGGWDGGLPRHALKGFAATPDPTIAAVSHETRLDFTKEIHVAKPHYYAEEGTDLERVAMQFHAKRCHNTAKPDGTLANCNAQNVGGYVTNGAPPAIGAPYADPCIDDKGKRFTGTGEFFSEVPGGFFKATAPVRNADNPRIYKGAVIQLDAVLNKVGYHSPQQRILTLWQDVGPTLSNARAPEPLVMRINTYECSVYWHTNLVPAVYELDDYQIKTPTDIIGQHIHLPKWDLSTADGSGNGWNYEDGTLSPGAVRERIHAINAYNEAVAEGLKVRTLDGRDHLEALPHPSLAELGQAPGSATATSWLGARTSLQRWFADPVINVNRQDRGLGIVFTHDHFGPSTHQQIGLYGTVLVEPANSTWVHNETGQQLGTRADGGPTSWQAVIRGGATGEPFREFYLEFTDFQHAYEKGAGGVINADSFRKSINPSYRKNASGPFGVFPDLVLYPSSCPGGAPRPCPEAIAADDAGVLSVNYRQEPVGLRVFDPNALGPDGKKGAQKAGPGGDLALALQTRTDRAIPQLNTREGDMPYPPLTKDRRPGDPITPTMRVYEGDLVRVKVQAGGQEHEHNFTMNGMKWLQGGSGHGTAPNSGWRNAQSIGISEQFTMRTPVIPNVGERGQNHDYAWSIDGSQDGWWSGTWGVLRAYGAKRTDLYQVPASGSLPYVIANPQDFDGACPRSADRKVFFDVSAVLANDVLPKPDGVTIVPNDPNLARKHAGGTLKANGGTLVYNSRTTSLPNGKSGPLHDPTAAMYVRTGDLEPVNPDLPECADPTNYACPVRLKQDVPVEPLVMRAPAGSCLEVTLRNRLPAVMPDMPNYSALLGVVNRDRNSPQGLTAFQNNLVRPSSLVGLHPQLVEYDISRADGAQVGINRDQLVAPGETRSLQWFAGEIRPDRKATGPNVTLQTRAVEFGGVGLLPADRIKQGQKGLVGSLIIEPRGSTIAEDDNRRAAATVTLANSTEVRSFATVFQKGLGFRFADGSAVENLASEGVGIPEDSHDAGQAAINYGSEPAWFRLKVNPNAAFGNAATPDTLGSRTDAHKLYSNTLDGVGGDPVTPVFTAAPGQETRMHVVEPTGSGRGTTFHLHGHMWQRDPYVCRSPADLDTTVAIPGRCRDRQVASTIIGENKQGMWLGHQESVIPGSHFTMLLPKAGGNFEVEGDYLFRDQASFGNTNGLWGILRVE